MQDRTPGDCYRTDAGRRRLWRDRIWLGSRFYFMYRYLKVVLQSWRKVRRGVYDREAWVGASFDIMDFIEACGGRFSVQGLDRVRALQGPVVFVSNHMSMLETQVYPGLIAQYRELTFVVKESLVSYPLFGPVVSSRDPITVSRRNPREDLKKVLDEGRTRLEAGFSLMIFPQSTRSRAFDVEKFNTLGVKLAARAGVPVVPVAVKSDFWENGRITKDFGPIHRDREIMIEFGDAVSAEDQREAHRSTVEFIKNRLGQWGVPVAEGRTGSALRQADG